jgi:hypothetical protein
MPLAFHNSKSKKHIAYLSVQKSHLNIWPYIFNNAVDHNKYERFLLHTRRLSYLVAHEMETDADNGLIAVLFESYSSICHTTMSPGRLSVSAVT